MARIQFFLLTTGAVLLGLLGLFTYAKRAGAKAEQTRQNDQTLKVMRHAQDARNSVGSLPDTAVTDRLRQQWSRD